MLKRLEEFSDQVKEPDKIILAVIKELESYEGGARQDRVISIAEALGIQRQIADTELKKMWHAAEIYQPRLD